MSKSRLSLWTSVALLLTTLAIYAQVRLFDFVNFDDPDYIAPDSFVQAFTTARAANWFPLTRLSHMLDLWMYGAQPDGHHLTNVLLHTLAALLLFAILYRATGAQWPSAFVAFVFALHPLHVESVAWVAERKDVLCALFWFLSLWFYVKGRNRIALLFFACGLMSKPMIVTLPFTLLLLDIWPLRRRPTLRDKAPFFALSIAAAVVTFAVQSTGGAVRTLDTLPLDLRIGNALVSAVTYLGDFVYPAHLAVFYPYPLDLPAWKPALAALLLAAISAAVFRFRRTEPALLVGWLWYLITLAPVIGIVQVGGQSHADRYMYVPMIGLLIIVGWGAARWKPALLILAAACIPVTWAQLQYWQNSGTLFQHALDVTGENNYVAQHNLGNYLLSVPGQLPEATRHLEIALRLQPDSAQARTDLAIAQSQNERTAEAIAGFQEAARLNPASPVTQSNLATAEAEQHLQRGLALAHSGRAPEAIPEFEAALKLRPNYAEAHNNLGVVLSGNPARTADAIVHFEAALRLQPDYPDAHYNLGIALVDAGRPADAIPHLEAAYKSQPDPQLRQTIDRLRTGR